MKVCKSCSLSKDLSEFNNDSSRSDGYHPWCRECKSSRQSPLTVEQKAERYAYKVQWKRDNKDKVLAVSRKRYRERIEEGNKPYKLASEKTPEQLEKQRARVLRCYHKNKNSLKNVTYRKLTSPLRKSRIRKSVPSWLSSDQRQEITDIYRQCKNMSEFHETLFHVDHIEPIVGKVDGVHVSCGLTVPWNLEIIPARDNQSKGAKLKT
jgi:hypothetical protein